MITQTVTLEACEIFALFRPESFFFVCLFVFNVDLNAFDSDTDRNRNPNRVTPVPNFLHR